MVQYENKYRLSTAAALRASSSRWRGNRLADLTPGDKHWGVRNRGNHMRKIVVGAQVSMDGIMQAPGGPWEDPTKGFRFGG